MRITRLDLSSYDLEAMLIFIYGYQETLKFPEIFPEHTTRYDAVLAHLKMKFQVVAKSAFPLLLTDLEMVVMDMVMEGFIRLIERSIPTPKREEIIAPVVRFRPLFAVKWPH